jgi:hypothetical protein
MDGQIERAIPDPAQTVKPAPELPKTDEAARSFFSEEKKVLGDIAGGSGFTFKRGDGWAINPDTGEATYDPKFFEEKGYTPSQALFGAFHELRCHLVETADLLNTPEGQQAHERLKNREKGKQRIHIWENCRTDVKGNLAIMQFAPSLAGDVETVYKEKLWPEADLTSKPRHLQFMYAVLRTSMIPDEQVVVDPQVTQALERLRSIKGRDVIALATDPAQDPLLALRLSERYIEPVIEELYQQDLKDKKDQQPQSGEGKGQWSGSGEPFEGDYEDYESRHPEPMDEEEVEKKIKETKEHQSTSSRQEAGYEEEHGVSRKDIADYYEEYRQVASQIEPLRQVFRAIVEQRNIILRRMASLKEEGVMIDPGLVVQTYMDVQSGVTNPKTMKDFEGIVVPEDIPGKADIYFVKDLSVSMLGDKDREQRRGAILEAEALKEGDDMLEEEQLPDPLRLDINTAFVGFGVPVNKPNDPRVRTFKELSKGLTEKQRLEIFKRMLELGNIGTNDYDALVLIEEEIRQRTVNDSVFAAELKSGKRKVAVIVTTDGGSNYEGLSEPQARAQTNKKAEELRELGVKVKAIAFVPSAGDVGNIQEVYGVEDTTVCSSTDKYPESVRIILEKDVLSPLSITGDTEDVLPKVNN